MKFTKLRIPGVWLIEPEVHSDIRGSFHRDFCAREFAAHGLEARVVQGNISENLVKGTLRGFHYQVEPHGEAKTLSCLVGGVYDIVLDLRPSSPTYRKWEAVTFSAQDRRSLYVPAGCANAWITTESQTTLHYYMSEFYVADAGRGIRYNDPSFDFSWPAEPTVISDRDRNIPDFDPKSFQS
jgi:dTDP-4-dehydrorhamnose 3,5-epimerase